MTDRLSKLSDATQSLADRDFTTRLNIAGNDEIAQLASTFNAMARSLEEVEAQKQQLEQTRRDLTAWVSHDLRTPLASIRVMVEAMLDGVVDDEETVRRYLDNSSAEIEHLSSLIDDLFELAQLDVGHLQINIQPASLPDLISDTLGSMRLKAEQRGIELKGEVSDDIDIVLMAPDKIQRVLSNLVDNAIKYADSGLRVTLRALARQRRNPHRHPQQRLLHPRGCAASLVRELLSRRRLTGARRRWRAWHRPGPGHRPRFH